ncbi:Phytanoyl-CoA dioxygenase domain-containing protein 1 [Blattella germanica]|nr:Phytanoyl-CoA dioxygenase domain-containing protein 1 [Blattella germanica]
MNPKNYVQFLQDGYLVLDDFLSEKEVEELRKAGNDLTQNIPDESHRALFSTTDTHHQSKDKYFLESSDKISYFFETGALDKDGKLLVEPQVALNKVGHALHWLNPVFKKYTFFVPHQDATFLYTEPVKLIGFWIALEDATLENGCLWFAPGSHRGGVHRRFIRNSDSNSDELLIYDSPAPCYPTSNFRSVPVSKGSCVLIHGQVVHKSDTNKSQHSRHAYTFHIVDMNGTKYSPENWLQTKPEQPFPQLYKN